MTDSLTKLPPLTPGQVADGMAGWTSYLQTIAHDPRLLAAELTAINAQLQTEAARRAQTTLLLEAARTLDNPVLRSIPAEIPSRPARDDRPSPSPQPGPLDLLLSSRRAGPRLVAKLVASDVRRRGR